MIVTLASMPDEVINEEILLFWWDVLSHLNAYNPVPPSTQPQPFRTEVGKLNEPSTQGVNVKSPVKSCNYSYLHFFGLTLHAQISKRNYTFFSLM